MATKKLLTIIGLIFIIVGFVEFGYGGVGQNGLCLESGVSLVPGAVICQGSTTFQGEQYGSVWLNAANPVPVTSPSSTLTFYSPLGAGLSLTTFSAEYCTQSTLLVSKQCPSGSTPISMTNNGVQSSGVGSLSGAVPSFSAGATYYMEGHMTDSSGASYYTI